MRLKLFTLNLLLGLLCIPVSGQYHSNDCAVWPVWEECNPQDCYVVRKKEQTHTPITMAVKPVQQRKFHKQSGITAEQKKYIEANCFAGPPKLDKDWNHGLSHTVYREGYVLEHSAADRIPLWVSEGVSKQQLSGDQPRKDAFASDPELPGNVRAELSDYKGSGFDRGHMAPAGDQTTSKKLKAETFFLSNMSPQSGPLNQQSWRMLEDKCQNWTRKFGHSFIITGGMFYDPEEEDPSTADGQIDYSTIGKNKVAVPTHFYKLFVYEDKSGTRQAVAFVMENRAYKNGTRHEEVRQSIDWIEERAGINFMPELDPPEERRLERNVNDMPD